MFLKKTALDRRLFLRSVGATLALPLLDAMTPAFATTEQPVPRMAFLYVPNGANMGPVDTCRFRKRICFLSNAQIPRTIP